MLFIAVLIATTLSIAGSAAFFSIYGLAQIFTGSFLPVVIMASSLEAGKLVAASFVYRYWNNISLLLKSYLIAAIVILMVITSAGIFGFLSSAYQQDVLPIKTNQQNIQLLTEEKAELESLKNERLNRKKQIDTDIASLPNNYITARKRLMDAYGPEIEQLKIDIAEYTQQIRKNSTEIAELRNHVLEQEAHTGPIIFIAKVFDQEVDDSIKYLIMLIIFAFDPLAVVLTIGANIAILERKKEKGLTTPAANPIEEPCVSLGEPPIINPPVEEFEEPTPMMRTLDQILKASKAEDEAETSIAPDGVISNAADAVRYDRIIDPLHSPGPFSTKNINATLAQLKEHPMSKQDEIRKSMLESMLFKNQVKE